jgi:vacuolar-type H+-ATPase catalytic subunit A/Vma1
MADAGSYTIEDTIAKMKTEKGRHSRSFDEIRMAG